MTIRSVLIALPLMLLGWMATLMVTALFLERAPAYVVLFPSDSFLASLPEGISLVSASPVSVTLRSDEESIVPVLYGAGARAVLPAGLRGCLPLSLVE